MKSYKERGGWFWVVLAVTMLVISLIHHRWGDINGFQHIHYTVVIGISIIMSKLERMANALYDRDQ